MRIGDVDITPVYETEAGAPIQRGIAAATPSALRGTDGMRPAFATEDGTMRAVVQAFVVRSGGTTVLVDAGVGNGKPRPDLPEWDGLETAFLRRLADAGVVPEDVDLVVNTHLHFDHVGWNTTRVDGSWAPTFPRARYLITRDEFAYWRTEPQCETRDDRTGFVDSVRPVADADLLDLCAPDRALCDGVRLLDTAGHTPGHVSVLVESAGETAVITGDAIHHPCQVANPAWGIGSDFDPARARRVRVGLLDRCADAGGLLIGSHFASPTGVAVRRDDAGFTPVSPRSS
jgi:glyoxylase-like metal-dependent hydrolase (beta-lactamase superfamily II)